MPLSISHLTNSSRAVVLKKVNHDFTSYETRKPGAASLRVPLLGLSCEYKGARASPRRCEEATARSTVARSKGRTLGRPKVRRDHDRDAKRIRQLRDEGQSYREIAEELGRSTMDVHRVAMPPMSLGT